MILQKMQAAIVAILGCTIGLMDDQKVVFI